MAGSRVGAIGETRAAGPCGQWGRWGDTRVARNGGRPLRSQRPKTYSDAKAGGHSVSPFAVSADSVGQHFALLSRDAIIWVVTMAVACKVGWTLVDAWPPWTRDSVSDLSCLCLLAVSREDRLGYATRRRCVRYEQNGRALRRTGEGGRAHQAFACPNG